MYIVTTLAHELFTFPWVFKTKMPLSVLSHIFVSHQTLIFIQCRCRTMMPYNGAVIIIFFMRIYILIFEV